MASKLQDSLLDQAQKKALSPKWRSSLLRSSQHPWMQSLVAIPCLAHRIHNAFVNAISKNDEVRSISTHVHDLSTILIEKEKIIGAKCPRHVNTRWIYDFDIYRFIKNHYEKCSLVVVIHDDVEPFYEIATIFKTLTTIFEDPKTPLGSTYPILEKSIFALDELSESIPITQYFCESMQHYTLRSVDASLWLFAYCLTRKGQAEFLDRFQNPTKSLKTKASFQIKLSIHKRKSTQAKLMIFLTKR
jgi:hypothetical protein